MLDVNAKNGVELKLGKVRISGLGSVTVKVRFIRLGLLGLRLGIGLGIRVRVVKKSNATRLSR